MIEKAAVELARYYLINHGARCYGSDPCSFNFEFCRHHFRLVVWREIGIDIRHRGQDAFYDFTSATPIGPWLFVNLQYWDTDITDPSFNPEVFFKPILTKLELELI